MIERIVSALIFFHAGFFLYFLLMDRVLLHLGETLVKKFLVYSSMSMLLIGAPVWGYRQGITPWLVIPSGILVILLAGEIRLRWKRKRLNRRELPVIFRKRLSKIPFHTSEDLVIRKTELPFEHWEGEPLRFVHLTDLHIGKKPGSKFFFDIADSVNAMKPDIIVLTGDYLNHRKYVPLLTAFLKRLKARYGVFGIMGNHEFFRENKGVETALRDARVTMLSGHCRRVTLSDGKGVRLCGHEAPWGSSLDFSRLDEDTPTLSIVLTHTPDNIFALQHKNVDIVFAGHLHGGQWRLPLIESLLVPSRYGRLLDRGVFSIGKTRLVVSSGIGLVWFPWRIRCEPEIVVVDVVPSRRAEQGHLSRDKWDVGEEEGNRVLSSCAR